MSQILTLELDLSLEEIQAGLSRRDISVKRVPGRRVMLPASAECIPEPVDLYCPAGSADSLEAWGFRQQDNRLLLVCGQFDRDQLISALLNPLRKEIATQRVTRALEELQGAQTTQEEAAEIITIEAGS